VCRSQSNEPHVRGMLLVKSLQVDAHADEWRRNRRKAGVAGVQAVTLGPAYGNRSERYLVSCRTAA
jgi:hypothetical protein